MLAYNSQDIGDRMSRTVFRLGLLFVSLVAFVTPASAQSGTIGYSWQGATLANEGSGWPPDTHGSVGINQFVQAVNGGYQMYNKDGSGYSYPTNYISNNTFWTSKVSGVTPGGVGFTDPRIYYDPMSQRWFAVEITVTSGSGVNNRIMIARSDTSDPRGSWKGLTVNSPSNQFSDYPTLAVDANGLYVGTNNFNTSGAFAGRSIVSVPMANFLANPSTTTPTVSHNPTNGTDPIGFTLHGVTDTTGATVGLTSALMFGTGVTVGTNDVLARTIINTPGGTATFTFPTGSNGGYITTLASKTSQTFAGQSGTSSTLDNGDNRNGSAIYRVGNLIYMARAVDDGSATHRSVARWTILQVNNSTNAVTVVREGTVDLGGSTHAFFPSIAANSRGDFVMSFSRSSTTEFPSIQAVVGSTTDFSNWSVSSPMTLQAGLTFQNIGSGGGNRWGDYSATTRDPSDPGSFWVTNEYMHNVAAGGLNANQNWATRVVEVIPTVAGEVRWKNPATGAFATATNWQTGVAATSTDHVIFSRWSGTSYQVDLPTGTTTTNDRLSVRQTGTGTVTFNIASGATWSLTNASATSPSLAISEFQGQSNVVVSGGGTLQTNFAIIAGQSGGTGNLTITGVSTTSTTWNNANDLFIGGTSGANGGTGTLTVSAGAAANIGGTLKLWNSASAVTVTGTNSALSVAGLTNQSGSSPTITVNANAALNITDGLGTTYSGIIAGAGAVNKSGVGTMTFTGNNTYSGQTTVSAGTLLVNGQTGSNSGTGTGAVVLNGGTLGGNGRMGGTVAVNSTATLAPGSGDIGTLTVAGNTVFNNGGKFGVEAAASGTADRLSIAGASTTLDFKTSSILSLSLLSGFSNSGPASYTLATMPGGSGNNILLDGVPTVDGTPLGLYVQGIGATGPVIIQPSGMSLNDGDQFLLVRSGDNVVLQFSPVPEPSTVLALAFGALGAGALIRRRRGKLPAISCQ